MAEPTMIKVRLGSWWLLEPRTYWRRDGNKLCFVMENRDPIYLPPGVHHPSALRPEPDRR